MAARGFQHGIVEPDSAQEAVIGLNVGPCFQGGPARASPVPGAGRAAGEGNDDFREDARA
jgi:hypothetical protein